MKLFEIAGGNPYVLIRYDDENASWGPNSITDYAEILGLSASVDELKQKAASDFPGDESGEWSQQKNGQWISYALYDGQPNKRQYLIIKQLQL